MENINGENHNRELRFHFANIANENFDLQVEEVVNFENEEGLIFGETDLVYDELNNDDQEEEITQVGNRWFMKTLL